MQGQHVVYSLRKLFLTLLCPCPALVKMVLVVWASKIVQGALAAAIAPALTGITLGLVGQEKLPLRLGKNEAWNHAGNCSTAFLGGVVGYFYGIPGVFAIMALMGLLVVICISGINPGHIDNAVARGLEPHQERGTVSFAELLSNYALLAIAVTLFFFHLGNAALLPLLGQSAVARFKLDPAVYPEETLIPFGQRCSNETQRFPKLQKCPYENEL